MNYIQRTKLPFGHKEIIGAVTSIIERENEEKFREEIRSYVDCIDVKLFNMGRTALYTALRSINIKEGDKVLLPAFCCLVVPEMILRLGAKPVMVDIDPKTFNIDVEKVKENLDVKTKAIIPIHLFGHPADMGGIMDIAEDDGVYVIEDSAQAMGAEYGGKKVGSFGYASIFSLGHGKNITAGEGGILTVNDESLKIDLNKIQDSMGNPSTRRALSNFSKQIGYSILSHPFLYRVIQPYMDNIAKKRDAQFLKLVEDLYKKKFSQKYPIEITRMSSVIIAIGLVQFKKLDRLNQKRIENAEYLSRRIKHEGITLPYVANNCKHVFLRYAIKVDETELGLSRDEVLNILRSDGVDAETPYLYVKKHNTIYKKITGYNGHFPVSDELVDSIICLPVHPCLDKNDLKHVISVFTKL